MDLKALINLAECGGQWVLYLFYQVMDIEILHTFKIQISNTTNATKECQNSNIKWQN
jgi:hypothetical protein